MVLSNLFPSSNKIKVYELQNDYVDPLDLKNIKKLNQSLCTDFIFFSIGSVLGLFLFFMFFQDYFSTDSFVIDMTFIFIIIGIIVLFCFLVFSLIQVKNRLKLNYSKAQYGIVADKYTLSSSDDRNYYINVTFPVNNSFLPSVRCLFNTYENLNKDSKVLVVSFDNKIAFAVLVNS